MTPPVQGPGSGLNAAVAAELRAEIARQRRSTQWLSNESGVAYGSLRRYLAAERHIDVSVLAALCDTLGVTMHSLFAAAEAAVSEGSPTVDIAMAAHPDQGDIAGEQDRRHDT